MDYSLRAANHRHDLWLIIMMSVRSIWWTDDDVSAPRNRVRHRACRPLAPSSGMQARAGRPATGRPALRDLRANIFANFFAQKPLPPRCRAAGSRPAAGVYSCKFRNRKYIFFKNENKKIKKIAPAQALLYGSLFGRFQGLSFFMSWLYISNSQELHDSSPPGNAVNILSYTDV